MKMDQKIESNKHGDSLKLDSKLLTFGMLRKFGRFLKNYIS
jgi:hypothetical protein